MLRVGSDDGSLWLAAFRESRRKIVCGRHFAVPQEISAEHAEPIRGSRERLRQFNRQ
jgi:hypothetical protein